MDIASVLRNAGLEVIEDRKSARPGTFSPVGVMLHHTAGTDSRRICRDGRPGISGPLCNALLRKDGVWVVFTDGRANDSGLGTKAVLDAVKRDATTLPKPIKGDVSGNAYFYDVEVENLGNGRDPYPDVQLQSLWVGVAAICAAQGWAETRVLHHRQWTSRKIDMSWDGDARAQVRAALNGATPPPPRNNEDTMFCSKGDNNSKVEALQALLKQAGRDLGTYGPRKDGIDGDYGSATAKALAAVIGGNGETYGPREYAALIAKLSGGASASHNHDGRYAPVKHGHGGTVTVR